MEDKRPKPVKFHTGIRTNASQGLKEPSSDRTKRTVFGADPGQSSVELMEAREMERRRQRKRREAASIANPAYLKALEDKECEFEIQAGTSQGGLRTKQDDRHLSISQESSYRSIVCKTRTGSNRSTFNAELLG